MLRRFSLLLSFLTVFSVMETSFAADIHGIRVWPAPESTRVVFDLSAAVEYDVLKLKNPSRIVVDFKNSKALKSLAAPVSKNKLLKKVRSASKQGNAYRVVLDMRHEVKVKSFQLSPEKQRGHRLVLDLIDPKAVAVKKTRQLPNQQVAKLPTQQNTPKSNPVKAGSTQASTAKAKQTNQTTGQKKPALRDLVVAVDAGHGGKDPGALGKRGTKEKDVVLAISKKLARKINSTQGMRAVLTRSTDKYLPLRERMEIARKNKADLFISIHADAFKNHNVQGSSVYVLSENGASSEAARWLAEKENSVDFIGGVTLETEDKLLKEVLIDLSQNAVLDASTNIADKVLDGLKKVGKVHKPSVQHAGFVVLKSPDIPSILIETAFISNPSEERKLLNPKQQTKLVSAIHKGITQYFSEYAPPGTRLVSR